MARGGARRLIDRYITVATGEMAREPKTHLLILSKYVCMYVWSSRTAEYASTG